MATADTRIDVACPDDLAPLFQWHRRDWTQGVIVAPDPMFLAMRTKIFALATRGGVPAIYNQREFVIDGVSWVAGRES